jgi:biopolymer transport protein ExbD
MSISLGGDDKVKSEPNVVPLCDVLLVLLIIFMIVTPLISAGFKATMPKGANLDPDPEGENEVILGVDESGNYYIDGRAVAKGALEDQLKAKYATREKDKILYLKADNQLAYGSVQEAIEIARTAGVRVIAAVTDRDGGLFAADKAKKEGK